MTILPQQIRGVQELISVAPDPTLEASCVF